MEKDGVVLSKIDSSKAKKTTKFKSNSGTPQPTPTAAAHEYPPCGSSLLLAWMVRFLNQQLFLGYLPVLLPQAEAKRIRILFSHKTLLLLHLSRVHRSSSTCPLSNTGVSAITVSVRSYKSYLLGQDSTTTVPLLLSTRNTSMTTVSYSRICTFSVTSTRLT